MAQLYPLLPNPSTQALVVPVAQTQVSRVDRAAVLVYEEDRGQARAQDSAEWRGRFEARLEHPADRQGSTGQNPHRAQARDYPHYWPTAAFFTQQLSQESLPDASPAVNHGDAARRYPTLAFDSDIILPNEADATSIAQMRRVDITV